jgi:hypothetical protein
MSINSTIVPTFTVLTGSGVAHISDNPFIALKNAICELKLRKHTMSDRKEACFEKHSNCGKFNSKPFKWSDWKIQGMN